MLRLAAVLFLSLFATLAHANDFEDADKDWKQGQPWPAHWGKYYRPYKEGWNTIFLGFVHKVYDQDEAADTWLKHIPSAMLKGASVEICMFKHGLLETGGICKPAVVDPTIVGTLKEDDVIAFFYPNHGTKLFSTGPGSDARTTMRVFQKIAPAGERTCWIREVLVYQRPIAPVCWERIDMALVENILTRDFGPREGVAVAANTSSFSASSAFIKEVETKPNVESVPETEKKESTGETVQTASGK